MHQAHLPRLAKLLATLLVLTLSLASVKAQQHTIVLLANGQKDLAGINKLTSSKQYNIKF